MLRETAHLSQQELADRAGLHIGQVSCYEREVIGPTAEKVLLLAQALGVTTDTLLGRPSAVKELPNIKNPLLFERFVVLQDLDRDDQDAAMRVIDALITSRAHENVTKRATSR
jgi:transcriptional regulator with XRE-family HTH domain